MIRSLIINNFCFLLLHFQLRDVITGKAWALCRKHSAGNLHKVTKCVCVCAVKGIKAKLGPGFGKQSRKCVFCSVVFQEQCLFNSKQQRAQTWLLCDHAEDVILLFSHRAKKTMSAAHQPLRSGLGVCWCPLAAPSCPCLLLEAWLARSGCGARAGPGQGKSKQLSGAAKGRSALASCCRRGQSGRGSLAFLPMLQGCPRAGVFR